MMEKLQMHGLPETIEVHRLFLSEDGRISMIAKSAMDESWVDEIDHVNHESVDCKKHEGKIR